MGYRVIVPLVVFTHRDGPNKGKQEYVYENGPVPEWVKGEYLDELKQSEMVATDKAAEAEIAEHGLAADTPVEITEPAKPGRKN